MRFLWLWSLVAVVLSVSVQGTDDDDGIYKIGVGIGDITGPPGGVVLNGYVNPITYASGIHLRQFARAFVVESLTTGNAVVYVTCDMGMLDHSIKAEVVKRLESRYGPKYSSKNVMISVTHTHSGVSGFMTYYAYLIIESQGFNPITFWAAVDGITEAIEKAEASLVEGRLSWNEGVIEDGNGNRRSDQYEQNPEDERSRYDSNVDREMTILKMESVGGDPIGVFTWWPVHPISWNGAFNPLVSSDNKGYAAILFDQKIEPGVPPGKGKFVSGFGSSNLGDVTGRYQREERYNYTDDLRDTKQLGTKQFDKAWELFNDAENLVQITGPIRFAHQFVDPETVRVEVEDEVTGHKEILGLCKAALGFSYVGLDPNEFWEAVRDFIQVPSPEMVACQAPKIVALAAGEMDKPWEWAPRQFALQSFQVGTFDLVGLPAEYTTMAGRRVRNAVYNATHHKVVLAGMANSYINYVATPQEYDFLEYEGGATIYGRNSVPVTAALFKLQAEAMLKNEQDLIDDGTPNPSFLEKVRQQILPRVDQLAAGTQFGDLIAQPGDLVRVGQVAEAAFSGASGRHSPMRRGTFLLVERQNDDTRAWEVVKTDADVDTTFWYNALSRRVIIKWHIGEDTFPGTYRIRHFGYFVQNEDQGPRPYSGSTRPFTVAA